MTAGPMTCMDCGGVLPTHNAWCDALRPRPVPAPAEPSVPCRVCEAAHALCLSGDPAKAADFIKAAVVQERKAKEAAEAERDRLRAALATSEKERRALDEALTIRRELHDETLLRCVNAERDRDEARAALAAERAKNNRDEPIVRACIECANTVQGFIPEWGTIVEAVISAGYDVNGWTAKNALERIARRAAEAKPADPAVFTHRPGCHHANPDHGKGSMRCRCACFCPRPEPGQRASGANP